MILGDTMRDTLRHSKRDSKIDRSTIQLINSFVAQSRTIYLFDRRECAQSNRTTARNAAFPTKTKIYFYFPVYYFFHLTYLYHLKINQGVIKSNSSNNNARPTVNIIIVRECDSDRSIVNCNSWSVSLTKSVACLPATWTYIKCHNIKSKTNEVEKN